MHTIIEPQTPRLNLLAWQDRHVAPFAAMNADPEVMRYFPAPLTRAQSDALTDVLAAHFDEHGWGLFALELRDGGAFVGFTGLARVPFEAHFTPAVEVGWRLARSAWGHGYATEAARASLAFGFERLGLAEIVSFAVLANARSIAVMRRLGMQHEGEFDNPRLQPGSPLRRHVLYRLKADRAAREPAATRSK